MSQWYGRLFGETDVFAVRLSFFRDPHPARGLPAELVESWGSFEVWSRGRCLTRNHQAEGASVDGVTGYLLPLMEWLVEQGPRLLNEEPLPMAVARESIRSACDWLRCSEEPILTLREDEEDAWFTRRSEWRARHVFRAGIPDAAFPMLLMRRVDDAVELFWDNEHWGTPRPELEFTERSGVALAPARTVAAVILEMLTSGGEALHARCGGARTGRLLEALTRLKEGRPDWRWLVHRETAEVVERIPKLRDELDARVRDQERGPVVDHSDLTGLLRGVRATRTEDVEALLHLLPAAGGGSLPPALARLRQPMEPDPLRPWLQGYEAALSCREALRWGTRPLPPLPEWLHEHGVHHRELDLGSQVDLVAVVGEERRPAFFENPYTARRRRREMALATGVGHLLMDTGGVAVDGVWEYWPRAARARAFAAMWTMPEDGVRELARRGGGATEDAVRAVVRHYGTSPLAAIWHMKNLGLLGEEQGDAMLQSIRD